MLETWSQCTIQSFKRSTGEYPEELKLFYINNPPEGGIAQLVERLLCKQDQTVKDHFNVEIKKPTANEPLRTLSTIDLDVTHVPSNGAAAGNYPKSTSRQYLLVSFLTLFFPTSTTA